MPSAPSTSVTNTRLPSVAVPWMRTGRPRARLAGADLLDVRADPHAPIAPGGGWPPPGWCVAAVDGPPIHAPSDGHVAGGASGRVRRLDVEGRVLERALGGAGAGLGG